MKKIVFAVILICMPLFANADKVRKSADSQPEKTIPVDVVKDKIKGELDSLMTYIKNTLNEDVKLKRNPLGPIKVDTTQFFYKNDSLALQQQNFKTTTIKQVHKELSVNETYKNEFSYGTIKVVSIEKDTIKDNRYHASVEFESRNIVKTPSDSLLSDARYDVKMNVTFMMAESKEKIMDENNKLTGTKTVYKVRKWIIKECNVNPKNYLSTEKAAIKRIAEDAIKDWYNNLRYNLDVDKLKESNSLIDVGKVESVNGVEVDGNMDYENLTYTCSGKSVEIDIDPSPFIPREEKYLYESEPSATVRFTPVFSVQITNEPYSLKDKPEVKYEDVEIKKPITIKEKTIRKNAAEEFIKDYSNKLAEYASAEKSERAALRTGLEAMFASNSVIIEVSYLPKGGKERKIERKVGKYLTLLKDAELTVTDIVCKEVKDNVESIEYSFTQLFRGKKYSDEVTKVVKMEYQNENDRWVITGITIDGPTRPYKSL